jgi:molybdopterin converting factor small subunit
VTTVRIPPVLRGSADGAREVAVEGATVAEVLEALYERHPAIRGQLEASDGTLHRFVNLYLNDEDVRMLGWLETPVSSGDTVTILPAMAGGSERRR